MVPSLAVLLSDSLALLLSSLYPPKQPSLQLRWICELLPKTNLFQGSRKLRLLLSFAVGGLLGDVFLHLFPESLAALGDHGRSHTGLLVMGLWILGGILTFLILEKIFEFTDEDEEKNNNKMEVGKKRILGYLNLAANCIDNFIHGLAVASSFLSSFKLGLITTFAILVHEIPHEIGDFAILLRYHT